jgi:CubicO group peptidase (beta-lactamase class C family)
MWRPVIAIGDTAGPGGVPESMGLGFFLLGDVAPAGASIVGHTGSQAGFLAFLWINPRNRSAGIAALNTNSALPGGPEAFARMNREMVRLLH